MSSDRETIGEHDAQREDERPHRHARDQAKDYDKDHDSPGATIDDAEPAEPNEPG